MAIAPTATAVTAPNVAIMAKLENSGTVGVGPGEEVLVGEKTGWYEKV